MIQTMHPDRAGAELIYKLAWRASGGIQAVYAQILLRDLTTTGHAIPRWLAAKVPAKQLVAAPGVATSPVTSAASPAVAIGAAIVGIGAALLLAWRRHGTWHSDQVGAEP